MAELNRAYLGHGDWIEIRDVAPPIERDHVDIPLRDVTPMIVEVLRRDLLNRGQASEILQAAEQSLHRQGSAQA